MVGHGILANHYVHTAWTGHPYGEVMDTNGFWMCEGLIDGETCPREGGM